MPAKRCLALLLAVVVLAPGCLDGPGDAPVDGPEARSTVNATFGFYNDDDEQHQVEVTISRGNETLLDEGYRVTAGPGHGGGGNTVSLKESLSYDVTADILGREWKYTWHVTKASDRLDIAIGRDESVTFSQRIVCDPSCDPVSLGGESAELPYGDGELEFGEASLMIENRHDSAENLTVAVLDSDEGEEFFRYRYTVRPNWRITVPDLVSERGNYTVRVENGNGETATYEFPVWHGYAKARVLLNETGALRIDCGETRGRVRVYNGDNRSHDLTLSLLDRDEVVYEDSFELAPGDEEVVSDAVPRSGKYTVKTVLGSGENATSEWAICYCSEEGRVRIKQSGGIELGQRVCN